MIRRVIFNDIIKEFLNARKDIIKSMKNEKINEISIWGASLTGEIVFYLLKESDIKIRNFYDSYKKGSFMGLPILNPYTKFEDIPVILAISEPTEKIEDVINYLKQKNVKFFIANNMNYKMKDLSWFKNMHKGRRCFVIGNGPSLNKIEMNKLKDEITFGANRIYLGFNRWDFSLKYWTIEDKLVAEDTAQEWNNLTGPIKFIPDDLNYLITNYDNIVTFHFERKDFENSILSFSDDWCKLYWGGTVTYLMIQLATVMGCNPIYLIGIDFYYEKPKHIKYGKNKSEWISQGDDPNHFDPNYFGKGRKWHDPRLDRMKGAYLTAKEFLDKKEIKIFNATPGTRLTVFPLIDFNDLF